MLSTQFGVGLAAPVVTGLVLLRADRRKTRRLLVLPAVWLAPLMLGGLFVDPGQSAKTADWIGYVALGMLGVYGFAVAWCLITLRGARWVAFGCAVINAPVLLMSALVLAMASSGTWL